MSEIASFTDEAFALLILENSWSVWKQLAKYPQGVPETETKALPKYTGTPAGTGRNEGWGNDGMSRFNELCDSVKRDREDNSIQFDRPYMLRRQAESNNRRKRKSMADAGAQRTAPAFDVELLRSQTDALTKADTPEEGGEGVERNTAALDGDGNAVVPTEI